MGDIVQRSAVISPCGLYRYRLSRWWDNDAEGSLPFVMLNPSTADASVDDPTIRRCMGFARRWGFGGIEVVNLYPFRATDPRDLVAASLAGVDVVSRVERDRHIVDALSEHENNGCPVAAWGAHPLSAAVTADVLALSNLWSFLGDLTKDGHPRHPLYLAGGTTRYMVTRERFEKLQREKREVLRG